MLPWPTSASWAPCTPCRGCSSRRPPSRPPAAAATAPPRHPTLTIHVRNDDLDDFNGAGAGLSVEIDPGDQVIEPCAGSCLALTADGSGDLTLSLPAPSGFAYKIPSTGTGPDDVVDSVGYRIVRETDVAKRVAYMTNGFIETTFQANGRERAPGAAMVFGTIYDCDDEAVSGATVRVFSEGSVVTPGTDATDPVFIYVDGLIPNLTAEHTSESGEYIARNVPVSGAGTLRVEVYGALVDGGARQRVACEEGLMLPDGYTVRPLRPLRSDYRMGSGCASP